MKQQFIGKSGNKEKIMKEYFSGNWRRRLDGTKRYK